MSQRSEWIQDRNFMADLYRIFQTHKVTIALFLSVGAFSALINFSTFTLLWRIVGFPYQFAVSIAYVFSVIVHFTGNRNLTFKSVGNHVPTQLCKYLTMVALNYMTTMLVMHLVVEIFHLSPYIGIACAIISTVGSGYLLSKYWVFKINNTIRV